MHSTLKLRDSDPHDDFAIAPEIVPAAWADKVLADITREGGSEANSPPDVKIPVSNQPPVPTSGASAAAPTVDTTFRAAAADDLPVSVQPPATSRWAKSAVMLVFALCSAAAAAAWQNHGDAAKQMISNWVPAFAVTSSPPATETAALGVQADAPVAQASAAEPPPPPAAAPQPQQEAALAASPESTQLQSMARDLAAMAQQVEQLKAGIAELKAKQPTIARDVAKTSEAKPAEMKPAAPNPRPRIAAAPPRTAAVPPHRPMQAYPPAQAAAPLPPPASTLPPPPQATARSADEPIVRPPMSLLDR